MECRNLDVIKQYIFIDLSRSKPGFDREILDRSDELSDSLKARDSEAIDDIVIRSDVKEDQDKLKTPEKLVEFIKTSYQKFERKVRRTYRKLKTKANNGEKKMIDYAKLVRAKILDWYYSLPFKGNPDRARYLALV